MPFKLGSFVKNAFQDTVKILFLLKHIRLSRQTLSCKRAKVWDITIVDTDSGLTPSVAS